jgi:hypothetical protein
MDEEIDKQKLKFKIPQLSGLTPNLSTNVNINSKTNTNIISFSRSNTNSVRALSAAPRSIEDKRKMWRSVIFNKEQSIIFIFNMELK